MRPEHYQLVVAIIGGLIPAVMTLITTMIKLKAGRLQAVPVPQPGTSAPGATGTGSEPATSVLRKSHFPKSLFIILIAAGCIIGFTVGAMTKESSAVVRLYAPQVKAQIAEAKIVEKNIEIRRIEAERQESLARPQLSPSEREAIIKKYDRKLNSATTEKAEFERIVREVR